MSQGIWAPRQIKISMVERIPLWAFSDFSFRQMRGSDIRVFGNPILQHVECDARSRPKIEAAIVYPGQRKIVQGENGCESINTLDLENKFGVSESRASEDQLQNDFEQQTNNWT